MTSDMSLRGPRRDAATSPVHEVVIDLTDAASTDEVLERMLACVEDLQGTVHVRLHGEPAPHVVVDDEELTSWSTRHLEIVLGPRPAAPPPAAPQPAAPPPAAPPPAAPPAHRDVARPSPPEPLDPPDAPSAEVVAEVTAAHGAWQEALANLRRHAREEPAPVERPDLGGLAPDTVETHLRTLRARPSAPEPDESRREASPARRESRLRTIGRAAAVLVTVSSAIGLLVIGRTALVRGVAVAAIAVLIGMAVSARRGVVADRERAATRARARTVLRTMELSTAHAHARHEATTALRQAGLPTDPDELATLLEAARTARAREQVRQGTRVAWDVREADLVADLAEATSRLRTALRRGGIAETMDVEVDLARLQARAVREPRMLQPSR